MDEKEMQKFIEKAYKDGKVRDLQEAFLEFPPDEEWHQGKLENVICENNAFYGDSHNIGDIVFVREYKYPNGSIVRNHMFVIVAQNNIAVPIENFGMIISSNLKKTYYKKNILLEKDSTNNLKKDSIVKTDVLYRILDKDILFKVGVVEKDKIMEYINSFNN